jgi:hypothetical protein
VLASGLVLAERGTVVAMAAAGGIAGQWRRALDPHPCGGPLAHPVGSDIPDLH